MKCLIGIQINDHQDVQRQAREQSDSWMKSQKESTRYEYEIQQRSCKVK